MNNQEIGKKGELIAQQYLYENGYDILEKNYRCNIGEIDIIAKKGDFLVFTEVKTRRSLQYGLPYESVTLAKQRKIRKVATYYMKVNGVTDVYCRFDVVSILLKSRSYKIEIFEDAF